jgi:FdhE protein
MATLARLVGHEPDTPALFAASIGQEDAAVDETAASHEVDVDALRAVIALVSLPFLQACRRHWATMVPEQWTAPHCPICASWPAFVEVRGIERARYARCGRCGAEWSARLLQCPHCDNNDHEQLQTLVPQGSGLRQRGEACTKCRTYVKILTRLRGCAPRDVYLEDLASVDLDIAALEAGDARPHGAGHRLAVTVTAQSARSPRFARWR